MRIEQIHARLGAEEHTSPTIGQRDLREMVAIGEYAQGEGVAAQSGQLRPPQGQVLGHVVEIQQASLDQGPQAHAVFDQLRQEDAELVGARAFGMPTVEGDGERVEETEGRRQPVGQRRRPVPRALKRICHETRTEPACCHAVHCSNATRHALGRRPHAGVGNYRMMGCLTCRPCSATTAARQSPS